MLYKPKNISPAVGTTNPVVYLSEEEEEQVNFQVDGNELVQNAKIALYYKKNVDERPSSYASVSDSDLHFGDVVTRDQVNWKGKGDFENLTIKSTRGFNPFNEEYVSTNSKHPVSDEVSIKVVSNTDTPYFGYVYNELQPYRTLEWLSNDITESRVGFFTLKEKITDDALSKEIQYYNNLTISRQNQTHTVNRLYPLDMYQGNYPCFNYPLFSFLNSSFYGRLQCCSHAFKRDDLKLSFSNDTPYFFTNDELIVGNPLSFQMTFNDTKNGDMSITIQMRETSDYAFSGAWEKQKYSVEGTLKQISKSDTTMELTYNVNNLSLLEDTKILNIVAGNSDTEMSTVDFKFKTFKINCIWNASVNRWDCSEIIISTPIVLLAQINTHSTSYDYSYSGNLIQMIVDDYTVTAYSTSIRIGSLSAEKFTQSTTQFSTINAMKDSNLITINEFPTNALGNNNLFKFPWPHDIVDPTELNNPLCYYNIILNDNAQMSSHNFPLYIFNGTKPEIKINISQNFNRVYAEATLVSKINNPKYEEYSVAHLWTIYDQNKKVIYKTQKYYSNDTNYIFENLLMDYKYYITVDIEDQYGQVHTSDFIAIYTYTKKNDLYLNLQSSLDKENTGVKLKWDKPAYGEINFEFSNNNFTLENGVLVENGPGDEDISNLVRYAGIYGINLLEPLKNYISIKGSFNKWLLFDNNITIGEQTYDEVYWLGFLDGIIIYLCVKNNINYLILQDTHSAITLDPVEIEQNIDSKNFLQGIEINIKNKSILVQHNNKFSEIDTSSFPIFFEHQISLNLENISALDYIIASNDSMFNKDTNTWKNDDNLKWNPNDYSCLLTFSGDKPYSYLDPNANAQFIGYNMKRYNPLTQKVLDMGQYYFTQPDGKLEFYDDNTTLDTSDCIVGKVYSHPTTKDLYLWNGNSLIPYIERRFVDYSLPHNEEVKYLIYPQGNEIITDEEGNKTSQEQVFSPVYSDSIKGDWDKWCLFTTRGPVPKNLDGTADKGYNENVLLVDKIFFFEMNVETGSMKNNTDFSAIKNFTPYPHIQRSPSNYWSGQLKGLLGRLAIDDCTFKQTPTMLQEIKELTQNTSRKFLKDRDGNFWEVELSSDITIDNNDKLDVQLKTKSFNWVEVGDASDIALVSVGPGQEDWLLTELGQEQIDISRYIWDDNAIWDDNDFWTESE